MSVDRLSNKMILDFSSVVKDIFSAFSRRHCIKVYQSKMLLLRCSGIASTCHRYSLGIGTFSRSFHSSRSPKVPNVSSPEGSSSSNASKSASIGPFPLGRQPPPPVTGRMKNWKELSTPEKVARSGEQSFNFGIIIVGTVVFVILPSLIGNHS